MRNRLDQVKEHSVISTPNANLFHSSTLCVRDQYDSAWYFIFVVLYDCGCAVLCSLNEHQRKYSIRIEEKCMAIIYTLHTPIVWGILYSARLCVWMNDKVVC